MLSYIIWILAIILLIVFIYINYRVVFTSKYIVESKEVPPSFDNYRIVQISDWHETLYGKNNHRLVEKIKKLKPDVIFLTGDLTVKTHKDIDKTEIFLKQLNFCKVYFENNLKNELVDWNLLKFLELNKLNLTNFCLILQFINQHFKEKDILLQLMKCQEISKNLTEDNYDFINNLVKFLTEKNN